MTALTLGAPRPHIGNIRLKQSYQTTLAYATLVAVVLHFAVVGVAQLMIVQLSESALSSVMVREVPRYNHLLNPGSTGTVQAQTWEARAIQSKLKILEGLLVATERVSMVHGLTVLPHHRYTNWCAHICVSSAPGLLAPPFRTTPASLRRSVQEFL